jgi:hypothetical protein
MSERENNSRTSAIGREVYTFGVIELKINKPVLYE